MSGRMEIALQTADGERALVVEGRMAWALQQLITAGPKGCTPIDNPAPRWSDYVFKLRRLGINVETITEKHGGPFAGRHARYVIADTIRVIHGASGGQAVAA